MSDDSTNDIPDDGDDAGLSNYKYFLFLLVVGVVAAVVGYLWWRRRRNFRMQRKHHNDITAIARDIESSARSHEHRWSHGSRRSGRFHGLRSGRFGRNAWGLPDIAEVPPSYQASITDKDKELPSTSSSDASRDENTAQLSTPAATAPAASTSDPPAYVDLSRQPSTASGSSKDELRPPQQALLAPPKE